MNRFSLSSIGLVVALSSCVEDAPPMRPGVTLGDAAISLMDLGTPPDDQGAVMFTDHATPGDRATAADTGATITDAGVTTPSDTGVTTPSDTGVTTPSDTGVTTPSDTGVTTPSDTGVTTPADAGVADAGVADSGRCAAGEALCAGASGALECTTLRVSTLNCGACGVRCCGTADRCVAGVCTSRCPTLQVSCPATSAVDAGCVATRCIDVGTDDFNCGGCGRVCPDGTGCVSGNCI